MTQEKQKQEATGTPEEKHKFYINGMNNIHKDHKAILESALPYFVNELTSMPFSSENKELYNLGFEIGVNMHSLTLTPQKRKTFLNTYGSNGALFTRHYMKAQGIDSETGAPLENEAIIVGILEPSKMHDTDNKVEESELHIHSLVLITGQKIIPTHLIHKLFETRKISLSPNGSLIILIDVKEENTTYVERNTNAQLEEMLKTYKESLPKMDNKTTKNETTNEG